MRSQATAVLLGLCLGCAAFAVRADEADDDEPCQIPRAASRAEKCDYITEREDACEIDALFESFELDGSHELELDEVRRGESSGRRRVARGRRAWTPRVTAA